MNTPPGVAAVRRAFEESRPADIDSSVLESALHWLNTHDPGLVDRDGDLVVELITAELEFRGG